MRFCISLFLLILLAPAARAADSAERAIIGFSPDGRYFAFEQYGVQDGSGFPFSDIFVLDLPANAWVTGSPFRVRVDDETASLGAARKKSAKAAESLLTSLQISEPGLVLASQPVTEVVPDRRKVSFDPFYQLHEAEGRYMLSLTLLPFPASDKCYGDDDKQMGFSLTFTDNKTKRTKEVYKDTSVPASRTCPRTYDIADVVSHYVYEQGPRLVALIGVYTPGFEGSDRRYIAVPFTLP